MVQFGAQEKGRGDFKRGPGQLYKVQPKAPGHLPSRRQPLSTVCKGQESGSRDSGVRGMGDRGRNAWPTCSRGQWTVQWLCGFLELEVMCLGPAEASRIIPTPRGIGARCPWVIPQARRGPRLSVDGEPALPAWAGKPGDMEFHGARMGCTASHCIPEPRPVPQPLTTHTPWWCWPRRSWW